MSKSDDKSEDTQSLSDDSAHQSPSQHGCSKGQ